MAQAAGSFLSPAKWVGLQTAFVWAWPPWPKLYPPILHVIEIAVQYLILRTALQNQTWTHKRLDQNLQAPNWRANGRTCKCCIEIGPLCANPHWWIQGAGLMLQENHTIVSVQSKTEKNQCFGASPFDILPPKLYSSAGKTRRVEGTMCKPFANERRSSLWPAATSLRAASHSLSTCQHSRRHANQGLVKTNLGWEETSTKTWTGAALACWLWDVVVAGVLL